MRGLHQTTSTSASTATGAPFSPTSSGFTSMLTTSSRSVASVDSPTMMSTHRRPIDGGLAAHRSEDRLRSQLVEHLLGVGAVDGREPERDVGDRLGEHAADADHHARAELRVAVDADDELAVATNHRRDEHADLAVVRTGRREQLARGRGDLLGTPQPEAHEAALGLVRDRRRPPAWRRRGSRASAAASTAAEGSATRRSATHGTP